MISFELSCAMCGRERLFRPKTPPVDAKTTLEEVVRNARWIAQQNGDNFDIYCSKRCAA